MREVRRMVPRCRSKRRWFVLVWGAVSLMVALLAAQPSARATTADDNALAEDGRHVALTMLVATLARVDDAAAQTALMRGMLKGLEGRRQTEEPPGWSALYQRLRTSEEPTVRELAGRLSQQFGDPAAVRRSLRLLTDATVPLPVRRTTLHALLGQGVSEVGAQLALLLDDAELSLEAIRGFAAVERATAPTMLLERFSEWDAEHRRAVVETLASRRRYAEVLVAALDQELITRQDIPLHVARSLERMLADRFTRVYGPVPHLAANRSRLLAKYKQLISPQALATADPSRGRLVFRETCAKCHLLYGDGGKIGPDLTGSNRADLDYLLLNAVDPSYDVPDSYKMVEVVTVDGRLINGVIAEEDPVRLVLKTVEQPTVIIAKEDIDERRVLEKSIMPDGQFEELKPQQVIDLIKYLRTTEQVELPDGEPEHAH